MPDEKRSNGIERPLGACSYRATTSSIQRPSMKWRLRNAVVRATESNIQQVDISAFLVTIAFGFTFHANCRHFPFFIPLQGPYWLQSPLLLVLCLHCITSKCQLSISPRVALVTADILSFLTSVSLVANQLAFCKRIQMAVKV